MVVDQLMMSYFFLAYQWAAWTVQPGPGFTIAVKRFSYHHPKVLLRGRARRKGQTVRSFFGELIFIHPPSNETKGIVRHYWCVNWLHNGPFLPVVNMKTNLLFNSFQNSVRVDGGGAESRV